MSSYVLCIFEGENTEQNITNNLCKNILNNKHKTIIRASYGFNIYRLFSQIEDDTYLDTYELIAEELRKRQSRQQSQGKELRSEEQDVLNIQDPNLISDIYLIFDYDPHCSNADNKKLTKMLSTFNNPQEQGLLIISYPMVEAIRHQKNVTYHEELYSLEELKTYKKWIANNTTLDKRYQNWGIYDLNIWREITEQHLARANYLVNNILALPQDQIEQENIFDQQLSKHILPHKKLSVISSFPLMLFDYYGNELNKKLQAT